jgi:hypothetical protein
MLTPIYIITNIPWVSFGVSSCDFVDRLSGDLTDDPRNHTNQHEQKLRHPIFDTSSAAGGRCNEQL